MNIIIILIIITLVASLIVGFRRGIVREVGSLCGIVLALLACRMFGDAATDVAATVMNVSEENSAFSHYAAAVVGHGTLFLLVWLGVYIVARLLRSAIHAVKLGILDRMIGALFCCVKWNLVLSLLLNLAHIVSPASDIWAPAGGKAVIDSWLAFAPWVFGAISGAAV